jgi:arginase
MTQTSMQPTQSTLRLHFPQWQGGNNKAYYFGAQMLSWLAPKANGPVVEVEVEAPREDADLLLEDGIVGRAILLKQLAKAKQLIAERQPEKIVVLGGDCLIDLAPFSYLNEIHGGELAVLWVDAHPDIMTPAEFRHAHAMVLGNLLGQGDADFRSYVPVPLKPGNVMYAGINEMSDFEKNFIASHGLQFAGPHELQDSSETVLRWVKSLGGKKLAIHLDLDVLDPACLRSLLFAEPNIPADMYQGVAKGKMNIAQVVRLLDDVSQHIDIVGLGVAEHLPWDAIALKNMLGKLPLLRD